MEPPELDVSNHLNVLLSKYCIRQYDDIQMLRRFVHNQTNVNDMIRRTFSRLLDPSVKFRWNHRPFRSHVYTSNPNPISTFVFDHCTFGLIYTAAIAIRMPWSDSTNLMIRLFNVIPEFITNAYIDKTLAADVSGNADVSTICTYIDFFGGNQVFRKKFPVIIANLFNRYSLCTVFDAETESAVRLNPTISLRDISTVLQQISSVGIPIQYTWLNRTIAYRSISTLDIIKLFDLFTEHNAITGATEQMFYYLHQHEYMSDQRLLTEKALQLGLIPSVCSVMHILFEQACDLEKAITIKLFIRYHPHVLADIIRCKTMLEQVMIFITDAGVSLGGLSGISFGAYAESIFPDPCASYQRRFQLRLYGNAWNPVAQWIITRLSQTHDICNIAQVISSIEAICAKLSAN